MIFYKGLIPELNDKITIEGGDVYYYDHKSPLKIEIPKGTYVAFEWPKNLK